MALKTKFDRSTSESINLFKQALTPHILDIYNDIAFLANPPESIVDYYLSIIRNAIASSFRFKIDFLDFYESYLGLDPKQIKDKYAQHSIPEFIKFYSEDNGGKEILKALVKEMEDPICNY